MKKFSANAANPYNLNNSRSFLRILCFFHNLAETLNPFLRDHLFERPLLTFPLSESLNRGLTVPYNSMTPYSNKNWGYPHVWYQKKARRGGFQNRLLARRLGGGGGGGGKRVI